MSFRLFLRKDGRVLRGLKARAGQAPLRRWTSIPYGTDLRVDTLRLQYGKCVGSRNANRPLQLGRPPNNPPIYSPRRITRATGRGNHRTCQDAHGRVGRPVRHHFREDQGI